MIADLHAHYAMHLVPQTRGGLWRLLRSPAGRLRLRDWLRAVLVGLASLVANYRSPFSGPRVRMSYVRRGGVGIVMSVLYSFFDEVDVAHGPRPRAGYLETLEGQLDLVERHLRERHGEQAAVARNPRELTAAIGAGKVAFVHCVEGGFPLGAEPDHVEHAVRTLARRGVAYVTLAHLIWREVATDAPALPFLSDERYRRWFPQPDVGLSELGRTAVRAMVGERMLIDVAHMSDRALDDTLDLLDELDRDRRVPVLATHTGCRFGQQEYLLRRESIVRIGERDGVIGLIFAQHQLYDGLEGRTGRRLPATRRRRFERSLGVLRRHIDCLREATGSHRHVAIGSDLDGFIKPTLPELEDMRDMARLEHALLDRYGERDGALICSGNARRVLTSYWGGAP